MHRKHGEKITLGANEILEQESVSPNSMAGSRALEMELFADYPGMVALHDLASEEAEADEGRFRNSFPNLLIASLVIGGLLGTLISLAATLDGEALNNFINRRGATTTEFQEALAAVVKGFAHAFYASIAGVIGTVILILNRGILVRSLRESCFSALEELFKVLLPYFIQPPKDALKAATHILERGAENYADAVTSITDASSTVKESVAGLESAAEQATRAFGEDGTIASILGQFTEQVTELKLSTLTIAESGQQTSEALKELTAASQKLNKEVVQNSDKMAEKQADLVAEVVGSVETLDENLKTYPASIAEETSQALQRVSEESAKILQRFSEENSRTQKEITANNQTLADNQATLVSGLQTSMNSLAENQAGLVSGLQASVNSLAENQAGLVSGLQASVNSLASQLEKHPGSIDELAKLKNETIGTISSALQQQTRDFDKTIENLKLTLQTEHENVDSGWESLAKALEEAKQHQQQVAQSMGNLGDRLYLLGERMEKISPHPGNRTPKTASQPSGRFPPVTDTSEKGLRSWLFRRRGK